MRKDPPMTTYATARAQPAVDETGALIRRKPGFLHRAKRQAVRRAKIGKNNPADIEWLQRREEVSFPQPRRMGTVEDAVTLTSEVIPSCAWWVPSGVAGRQRSPVPGGDGD